MNLHEFQSKALFSEYGIPVPEGYPAATVDDAVAAARALGGGRWVVKAQVHAGGRGKAGGVKLVDSEDALKEAASSLLGSRLVTHQSGADGQPVNQVLVEATSDIDHEYYLACLVDRSLERVVVIASSEGGMDIETVAARNPEKILKAVVDPIAGLQPYQCRELAFALGLGGPAVAQFTRIVLAVYRLFTQRDLSLVEINPLITTKQGSVMALDAKINLDDSASFRQPDLMSLRDSSQEEEKEYRAQQFGLSYVALDGEIGCMVNGAGLAMATMDLIKLHGGSPANFLDLGGGTTAEKVAEAFKIILADEKVKAVLVNIFGGIVRCDLIAEGIITAIREVGIKVPVVVRLEGTNVEKGKELLEHSGLDVITASGLTHAAQRVVGAAKGVV